MLLLKFRPFADEGSFCTIAQGILLGKKLYTDLFNEKAPLQYLLTALFMFVFGETITVTRVVPALSFAAVSGIIAYKLAKGGTSLKLLFLVVLLFIISAISMQVFNNTAESSLALIYLSVILAHGLDPEGPPSHFKTLLVGGMMGLSLGFKQVAILPLIALFALTPGNKLKRRYGIGALCGISIWVFILLLWGNFLDFLWAGVAFHLGSDVLPTYWRLPFKGDFGGIFLFALALIPPTIASLKGDRRVRNILIIAVSAFLPFFFRMDAFRLLPAFVLLFLANVFLWVEGGFSKKAFTLAAVFTLFASLAFRPFSYWGSFDDYGKLIKTIEESSLEGAKIWVGPHDPVVYCITRREPASRFFFILPWTAKEVVKKELVADFELKKPALIIDRTDWSPFLPAALNEILPQFDEVMDKNYFKIAIFDGAVVYAPKR
ncbi:MAG: hypothetical protein Kow0090_13490 [Myxococcota bacterium]